MKFIKNRIFRDLTKRLNHLEAALLAFIDSPVYRSGSHAGFNGQKGRKDIFSDLIKTYRFQYLIETGTYLGDTAGYMAETSGLPVISCEQDRMFHAMAKMRLKEIPSISLHHLDSRRFLEHLRRDTGIPGHECFIYLDAHWGKDCPLREEVAIISENWERFIVMIDDFQVPGDNGYRYDRYGLFFKLNLPLLRPIIKKFGLRAFSPSMPSGDESKKDPRGCVILTRNNAFAEPLYALPSLRSHVL